MKIKLAIREVETFEVRTPFGPRRVLVHKKTGELEEEVPDEIANQIKDIPDLYDLGTIVEGVAVVSVELPEGQRYPQAIQFRFPSDVEDKDTAFARFEECLREEISRRQEEEQKSDHAIQTASEMDLEAINQMTQDGGIVSP